jgi:hypothetical protein
MEAPQSKTAGNLQIQRILFYHGSLANRAAELQGLRSLCISKRLSNNPFPRNTLGKPS